MENLIRLGASIGVFALMITWEYFSPRRQPDLSRKQRWPANIGLALFNMGLMRVTIGGIAYLSAVLAADHQWGLLNQFDLPSWLSVLICWLVLDMAIYWQHVLSHKWLILWRLHQVHHTDLEFDATTAVRFHPLEITLSMIYKVAWIYLIGADPLGVLIFEVVLNAAATFNHSNVNIPAAIDRKLRWLVITPDVHRIHHSPLKIETDSNYGFSISLWDRLFRTFREQPQQPHATMPIGLEEFRNPAKLRFWELLWLPFKPLKK